MSPTRLRVCFVVESGTDVRLVEGLGERYDLTVLARRIAGGVEISRPPRTPMRLVVGTGRRAGFGVSTIGHLVAARDAYDRVIVQGYGIAAMAANLAAGITGTPTYMLVCSPAEAYYRCRRTGVDPSKPYRVLGALAIAAAARVNALLGDRYITLSDHLREVVTRHGGGASIHVIPVYGVDCEYFSPRNTGVCDVRRRLDLPEQGQLIFFSSRVAPEKDAHTMLEATAMLRARGHDVFLLHCSGGHERFRRHADAAGIGERVIARDAVHPGHDLADHYRASDLCVQASREEGLGFSPLEALACGVPVVAADVGGLRETIRPGETGWSYPPGDAVALASAMGEALSDSVEASRRATAGRALVQHRFERKKVFGRLHDALSMP